MTFWITVVQYSNLEVIKPEFLLVLLFVMICMGEICFFKTEWKPLSLGNTTERRKRLGPVFQLMWIGCTVRICCSLISLWSGCSCLLTSTVNCLGNWPCGPVTGVLRLGLETRSWSTQWQSGGGFSSTELVRLHHYHYDQYKTVNSATNVCIQCDK
jgi:hypothetical protein